MKVTNVSDSFMFPAGNVVGDDAATVTRNKDETDDDYVKRSVDLRGQMATVSAARQALYAGGKTPDAEALAANTAAAVELQKSLNPQKVEQYKSLGANLPSDMVRVTLTLGQLVFDMFTITAEPPKPPLAAALFSKRVQNLASRVQNDEFDLTDELLGQIRPALEDDKKWAEINLTVYATVDGKKYYIRLNSNAAAFFPNVIQAAIKVFVPEAEAAADEAVAQEKAAPEAPKAATQPKAVADAAPQQAQA